MNKLVFLLLLTSIFAIGYKLFTLTPASELQQQYRPTQFEYQECHRALRCKDMQCPQTDKKCQENAWFFDDCQKKNAVCVKSWQDYEQMASDDQMTQSYYDCNKLCGPKQGVASEGFWTIYQCEATCGGIITN